MNLQLEQLITLQEKDFTLLGLQKKQNYCEQDLLTLERSIEELNGELKSFKQRLQAEEQRYQSDELQLITDEETLIRQKAQLAIIKKTNDCLALQAANTSLEERISQQQDALIEQLEVLEKLREEFVLKTQSVTLQIEELKTQQQQLKKQSQELSDSIHKQKLEIDNFASTIQGKFYDAYCVLKKSGKAYPWLVSVTETGKCAGCFLSLSTEVLSSLKMLQIPHFCEQCGRMLYQKEESDA